VVIYKVVLLNVIEKVNLGSLDDDVDGTKPEVLLDYLAKNNALLNPDEVEVVIQKRGCAYLKPKPNGLYDVAIPKDLVKLTYKTNVALIDYQGTMIMHHLPNDNYTVERERDAFDLEFFEYIKSQNQYLDESQLFTRCSHDFKHYNDLVLGAKFFNDAYYGDRLFSNYEIDLMSIFKDRVIVLPKDTLAKDIPEAAKKVMAS